MKTIGLSYSFALLMRTKIKSNCVSLDFPFVSLDSCTIWSFPANLRVTGSGQGAIWSDEKTKRQKDKKTKRQKKKLQSSWVRSGHHMVSLSCWYGNDISSIWIHLKYYYCLFVWYVCSIFFVVAENNVIVVISGMQSMLMDPNYYRDNVIYVRNT